MVVSETTRCRDIVSGLLNFARQGRLVTEETDINALLDETLAQLERQPSWKRSGSCANTTLDLPKAVVDAAQMRQVFLNIIVNAAEAMPDGGTLTVRTRTGRRRERRVHLLRRHGLSASPPENI